MSRILVTIVAAALALGSSAGFAADAAKKPELTKEERADMRNRAEKLTVERARMPAQADTAVVKTQAVGKTQPVAKTHKAAATHKTKTHKTTTRKAATHKAKTPAVKKSEPKV